VNDQVRQYQRLIDLLIERTRSDRIHWTWDKPNNTCITWFGNRALQIRREINQDLEELYFVYIFNKSGEILEAFSDEDIKSPHADGFAEKNYFTEMQGLYTLIYKRATGADVALSEILADLESGRDLTDDVPF
jgi:hypothetical protein